MKVKSRVMTLVGLVEFRGGGGSERRRNFRNENLKEKIHKKHLSEIKNNIKMYLRIEQLV
jgi:hypothetical protein